MASTSSKVVIGMEEATDSGGSAIYYMKNRSKSCTGFFVFLLRCVLDIWLPLELWAAIVFRDFFFGGFYVVCG